MRTSARAEIEWADAEILMRGKGVVSQVRLLLNSLFVSWKKEKRKEKERKKEVDLSFVQRKSPRA